MDVRKRWERIVSRVVGQYLVYEQIGRRRDLLMARRLKWLSKFRCVRLGRIILTLNRLISLKRACTRVQSFSYFILFFDNDNFIW